MFVWIIDNTRSAGLKGLIRGWSLQVIKRTTKDNTTHLSNARKASGSMSGMTTGLDWGTGP